MNIAFEGYRYELGELLMRAVADGEPVLCMASEKYLEDNFAADALSMSASVLDAIAEALKPVFAEKIEAAQFAAGAIRTVRV